jgi:hypothetical protein
MHSFISHLLRVNKIIGNGEQDKQRRFELL